MTEDLVSRSTAAVVMWLAARGLSVAHDTGRIIRMRHPGASSAAVYVRPSPQWVTVGDHSGRLELVADGRPWHRSRRADGAYYARHEDTLRHLGRPMGAEIELMARAVQREGPADARMTLRRILETARPCPPDHPHLVRHGAQLPADGWLVDRHGAIIVPIHRVESGQCVGAQRLLSAPLPDGLDRLYLRGSMPSGAVALVPPVYRAVAPQMLDPSRPIVIAEGVLSAWACHLAGVQAVACLSAAGLRPAVAALRARWPDAQLVIVADHDIAVRQGRLSSPTLRWAVQAAEEHRARIVTAWAGRHHGEDARDIWAHGGAEAVRRYLADARSPEETKRHIAQVLARSVSHDRGLGG